MCGGVGWFLVTGVLGCVPGFWWRLRYRRFVRGLVISPIGEGMGGIGDDCGDVRIGHITGCELGSGIGWFVVSFWR